MMWVRRSRAQSVLGSSYHLDPAKRNHEFESNLLRQPVSPFLSLGGVLPENSILPPKTREYRMDKHLTSVSKGQQGWQSARVSPRQVYQKLRLSLPERFIAAQTKRTHRALHLRGPSTLVRGCIVRARGHRVRSAWEDFRCEPRGLEFPNSPDHDFLMCGWWPRANFPRGRRRSDDRYRDRF
jgi:hypothetical protein